MRRNDCPRWIGICNRLAANRTIRRKSRIETGALLGGDVAGVDPADAAAIAGLHGERQTLGAQPQPDAAHRSELGEACKHGADRDADSFIRMEAHLAILVAPHEAHGKAAAWFAARCFVADAAEQARGVTGQQEGNNRGNSSFFACSISAASPTHSSAMPTASITPPCSTIDCCLA